MPTNTASNIIHLPDLRLRRLRSVRNVRKEQFTERAADRLIEVLAKKRSVRIVGSSGGQGFVVALAVKPTDHVFESLRAFNPPALLPLNLPKSESEFNFLRPSAGTVVDALMREGIEIEVEL